MATQRAQATGTGTPGAAGAAVHPAGAWSSAFSGPARDLDLVAGRLTGAARPVDAFGALPGGPAEQLGHLRRLYRQLALAVHPDRHADDPVATAAFVALRRLYADAQAVILGRCYGQAAAPTAAVTIRSRRRAYTLGAPLAEGEVATLYAATIDDGRTARGAVLKLARDPADNDLLANEASALRRLLAPADGETIPPYLPRLLESFLVRDTAGATRQANAFRAGGPAREPLAPADFFSLAEVRAAYPGGVDPKQMAWIWRRLLIALGHTHDREIVHGAVLPPHVLIHPAAHGLLLVGWCASVVQPHLTGRHIQIVSPAYERWYPAGVLAGTPPTPAVDLAMAVGCMLDLLGGDPATGALPPTVPAPLAAHLRGALAASAAGRVTAWQLARQFADLMAALWGPRRFVPFTMPARPARDPPRRG